MMSFGIDALVIASLPAGRQEGAQATTWQSIFDVHELLMLM